MNFALLLPLAERLLSLRSSANLRTPDGRAAAVAAGTGIVKDIREVVGGPDVPPPTEEEILGALENREAGHRLNQE